MNNTENSEKKVESSNIRLSSEARPGDMVVYSVRQGYLDVAVVVDIRDPVSGRGNGYATFLSTVKYDRYTKKKTRRNTYRNKPFMLIDTEAYFADTRKWAARVQGGNINGKVNWLEEVAEEEKILRDVIAIVKKYNEQGN